MMSDFMFPIYLATNKIQKRERKERKRRDTEGKQKEERPAVGQEKQERGKAKAQ